MPSRRNTGRIGQRSSPTMPSIVMSPPVTAAMPMKLPTSMCSGPIECAPPARRSTPVMCSTFEPMPWIRAPSETRNRQRSCTCGSHAAFEIIVLPGASAAAITAFSVAITEASSRCRCAPSRRAGELVALRRSRSSRRAPGRHGCAGSSRRRPITSPPGGGTLARPEARQQRPGEQERRADLARELGVDLVAHVGGVHAHLVRTDPLHIGARDATAAAHRLDVADARDVRERDGLVGQEAGGEDRQRPVLVARGAHVAGERIAPLDHERFRQWSDDGRGHGSGLC